MDNLYWLDQIQAPDRRLVGDKAFYLGQALQRGYPVVPGFVISAQVFRDFLEHIHWLEPLFTDLPSSSLHLDVDNPQQLQAIAQTIRQAIQASSLPEEWIEKLTIAAQAWQMPVLILRPSFTIQSNIASSVSRYTTGLLQTQLCYVESQAIAAAIKNVWAELFRAKSLVYWQRLGIQLQQIHLAVLVQPLQPAIAAGDMQAQQTLLTIRAVWGSGIALVSGDVMPDRYQIYLPTGVLQAQQLAVKHYSYGLKDLPNSTNLTETTLPLALNTYVQQDPITSDRQQQSVLAELQLQHLTRMGQSMIAELGVLANMEWILCHSPNAEPTFYLTQINPSLLTANVTRPIEVNPLSSPQPGAFPGQPPFYQSELPSSLSRSSSTVLEQQASLTSVLPGLPASRGTVLAQAVVLEAGQPTPTPFPQGVVLVAHTIQPNWAGFLKQLVGLVTEQGGMTSHGAIMARELGIPAVVGVAGAISRIRSGEAIYVDGDRGIVQQFDTATVPVLDQESEQSVASFTHPARVDDDRPAMEASSTPVSRAQPTATQLLINLSHVDLLAQAAQLPVDGVGLLRSEVLLRHHLNPLPSDHQGSVERQAELLSILTEQVQQFAQAFYPRPVFYRSLDVRSHEVAPIDSSMIEPNPALGIHGALSYQLNTALFELELTALKQIQQAGYTNINLLLPFVRTVEEFEFCRDRVQQVGLMQHPHFQLWIMAEVPSVIFLLPDYIKAGIQGISIGSNDLTQLLLAIDRDHPRMAKGFDPRHPAVMRAMQHLIQTARQAGIPCSICGQAPTQYPEIIDSLVRWGITSISVSPDAVKQTYQAIARAEQTLLLETVRRVETGS